jgi:glyoxylase I family protein
MPAPFAVRAIDHVVLRTHDPARLETFYVSALGCPVEKRQEKFGLTQLRAGSALIDIVALKPDEIAASPGSAGGNMDHLCLRVDPFEPEAIRRHLAGMGVVCGEVAARYGAEGRGPSIYFEDPEGNRIELKGPSTSAD